MLKLVSYVLISLIITNRPSKNHNVNKAIKQSHKGF